MELAVGLGFSQTKRDLLGVWCELIGKEMLVARRHTQDIGDASLENRTH